MTLALPCNSNSFMTSSVHKRWALMPHGAEGEELVVNGNAIAYRTVLAIARSVQWAVENPGGSKCMLLPTFYQLIIAHLWDWKPAWIYHLQMVGASVFLKSTSLIIGNLHLHGT